MKLSLVSFLLLSLGACNMSSAKTFQECEDLYVKTTNSELLSGLEKVNLLDQNGQGCMQYETYNLWLAIAYQDAGDYPKSVKIAHNALTFSKNDTPNLLQVIAEAELKTGDEGKAVKMAEDIAQQYPSYVPILGFLSEISDKKQDFKTSLKYAERSYNIEKNAHSLLWVAASLHQLGRHEETVAAVYKALEMEPQRIAKIAGVLEGIFSLAILNRRPEAAELAKRHIAANPNWRDNPTFAQAAKELGVAN